MKTLAIACQKGGVGKSTTCANLLVAFEEAGTRVAAVSTDTQGSLVLWAEARRAGGKPVTVLPLAPARVAEAAADAASAGFDWLLIDTPPTRSTADVAGAIDAADLVLVPVPAELFDIAAARSTIDLCRSRKRPYAIVLSRAPASIGFGEPQVLRDARSALGGLGAVFAGAIVARRAHSLAMAAGSGVTEGGDEKAAREIRQLRDWIIQEVGR